MLNPPEAKRILEAALLASQEPVSADRAQTFVRRRARRRRDPQAACRAGRGVAGPRGRAGQPVERLALPDPGRVPALPRAPVPGKAAALFARGDGDAGDHRLPPAGDAGRHRGRARRRGFDPDHPGAGDAAAGSTWSATAKPLAGQRFTPPRPSSSTTSACARWKSCRRSRKSPRRSSWRWSPLPKRPSAPQTPKPSPAKQNRKNEPLAPTAERLQKLLAAAGLGSRREIEGLDRWRDGSALNGQLAKLGDRAAPAIRPRGRQTGWPPEKSQPRVLLYHKPVGELVTRSDPQGRGNRIRQPAAGTLDCSRQARSE